MTDIIDLFLDTDNVEKMNRIFKSTSAGASNPCTPAPLRRRPQDCGMRAYMHEFIYGPYMAGLYDLWTGTDADLYLNHMNDEFIKYMEIRYQRKKQMPRALASAPSARIEMAAHLDPFSRDLAQRRRIEMSQTRRPITRGTGASMGGARQSIAAGAHCGRLSMEPCSLLPDTAFSCKCRGAVSGAASAMGVRDPTPGQRHAPGCSRGLRATQGGPEARPGAIADDYYARQNRDIGSSVHLASRDDEASDVGRLSYTEYYRNASSRAAPPYDFRESNPWLTDPTSESGQAQYHLIMLDSQISLFNDERTIPYGYGSAEDQLADDARVAARYSYRTPEVGVIPTTSYKKLIRVQPSFGLSTLEDDRIMARDIFARDSKGFILSGRR